MQLFNIVSAIAKKYHLTKTKSSTRDSTTAAGLKVSGQLVANATRFVAVRLEKIFVATLRLKSQRTGLL